MGTATDTFELVEDPQYGLVKKRDGEIVYDRDGGLMRVTLCGFSNGKLIPLNWVTHTEGPEDAANGVFIPASEREDWVHLGRGE